MVATVCKPFHHCPVPGIPVPALGKEGGATLKIYECRSLLAGHGAADVGTDNELPDMVRVSPIPHVVEGVVVVVQQLLSGCVRHDAAVLTQHAEGVNVKHIWVDNEWRFGCRRRQLLEIAK